MKKYIITEDDVKSLADLLTSEFACVKGYVKVDNCDKTCESCWEKLIVNDLCKPYTKECSCYSEAARRQVLLENMTEDV